MMPEIYIVVRDNKNSSYLELPHNYSWYFTDKYEALQSRDSFARVNPEVHYIVIPLTLK